MKKIVMTMVALLSMTVAVAQQHDGQQRREFKRPTPEQMANMMAQRLGLTDEQTQKLAQLNKEYEDVLAGPMMRRGQRGPRPDGETGATQQDDKQAKKDKKVKKDKKDKKDKNLEQGQRPQRPELTEEQKAAMAKQMEKRKEYDEKVKGILTEEQYKQYQQMRRPGFGRGHRGPGQRGFRPNGPRPETSMTE